MRLTTIRNVVAESPFRPFRLNLVNGTSLTIPHPEFISFPPTAERFARDCVVWMPQGGVRLVDVMHVGDVEFLESNEDQAEQVDSGQSP